MLCARSRRGEAGDSGLAPADREGAGSRTVPGESGASSRTIGAGFRTHPTP